MKKCSICGQDYKGSGNSAKPINDGRCCTDCDELVTARRAADVGHPFSKGAMNALAAASERVRIVMWIRQMARAVGTPAFREALEDTAQAIEDRLHH